MVTKLKRCLTDWWLLCSVLAILEVLCIWTDIWVPAYTFPLIIWILGLYLAFSQVSPKDTFEDKVYHPSDRAKLLEKSSKESSEVNWGQNLVLFFHGRRFPSGLKRPFDKRMCNALSRAVADATEHFEASTGYTFGQKAYFLFPARKCAPARLKLCPLKIEAASAVASYLSSRVVMHLAAIADSQGENCEELRKAIEKPVLFFAANAFNVMSQKETLNYFMNANHRECVADGVRRLAYLHFVPSEISGLDTQSIAKKLRKERDVDWNAQPNFFKYGIFTKRTKVPAEQSPSKADALEEFDADIAQEKGQLSIEIKLLEFSSKGVDFLFSEVSEVGKESSENLSCDLAIVTEKRNGSEKGKKDE